MVTIMMKVGNYEAKPLETVRNKKTAELKIKTYMRQDRYEVEVEKYPMFPYGYPVYFIKEGRV